MKISDVSIKKPVSVIVLMIAVWVVGIISFLRLPVNLLPDITYPLIKVYVNWRGATPEEIEDNIADVIEPKMATVDDLDYLESECTEGLYTLLVNFKYGVNRDIAYQDVLAKMGLVRKKLPKDADEPLIFKADPSQLPVMDLIVTSDNWDIVKLRTWVEHYLQLQFTSVPGCAGTEVSGGAVREIRVYLNPHKIQVLGLSIEKIAQRLKEENIELAGGRVTTERKEFIVRTKAYYKNLNEIKNLIIDNDKYGRIIYLRDIADVKDTSDIQRVITRLNKKEGVKLSIFKQAAANTIDVEKGIQQRLEELKSVLPAGVNIGVIYNQATYIRSANKGVQDAALIAALLVILVTWFFLGDWRRTIVIIIAMPLSILLTFTAMMLFGFSINILSLGGLVLAITVILDQSVIVLENITRHQEEKSAGITRIDKDTLVSTATSEVAKALTFAVLTFVALFLPFLLVPGLVSLLFHELIVIVAVAIASSMFVALTVTPMLAKYITKEQKEKITVGDKLLTWLKNWYQHSLNWALNHKIWIIILTLILFCLGLLMFKMLGSEFLPKADDGMITVKVKMPTGTSVQETDKVVKQIENAVKDLPYIESYSALSGGKVWGLVTYEIANEGEVDIQLVPKNKRKLSTDDFVAKYAKEIQKNVKYPGAKIKVFHTKMKGIRQIGEYDIEIELHSPKTVSLVEMYETTTKMISKIKDMGDISNLDVSIDITKPEYQLLINRTKVADLGLNALQIAGTIKTIIDGQIVTYYEEEGYYYPIRLVVDEKYFKGKEDVSNIPLFSKSGLIYLRDIGRVINMVSPVSVNRLDQMRVIKVTASVLSRDVGKVTSKVYEQVKNISLPSGSFLRTGGQAQMMRENFKALAMILILALFFAYVILAIQFESFIWPFLILLRIPFSLIGIVIALFITMTPIGVTVLIGILILAGIEIVHGVILLTFIQELIAKGKEIREAVIQGATIRMRPVLMTAFVGIIGLVPIAFGFGEGTELLQPMAIGVIGGLFFSLFLTFYFMPGAFLLIMNIKKKENKMNEQKES
jgi:hydrophobe/amphiphile efflux-1 (HAE1) family protein